MKNERRYCAFCRRRRRRRVSRPSERPSVKVFGAQQPASKCTGGREKPPRGATVRHRRGRKDPSGLSERSQGSRHLISLSLTGRYFPVLRFSPLYLYTPREKELLARALTCVASSLEKKLISEIVSPGKIRTHNRCSLFRTISSELRARVLYTLPRVYVSCVFL